MRLNCKGCPETRRKGFDSNGSLPCLSAISLFNYSEYFIIVEVNWMAKLERVYALGRMKVLSIIHGCTLYSILIFLEYRWKLWSDYGRSEAHKKHTLGIINVDQSVGHGEIFTWAKCQEFTKIISYPPVGTLHILPDFMSILPVIVKLLERLTDQHLHPY